MRDNRTRSEQRPTWTRRGWLSAAGVSVVGTAISTAPIGAVTDAQTPQQSQERRAFRSG